MIKQPNNNIFLPFPHYLLFPDFGACLFNKVVAEFFVRCLYAKSTNIAGSIMLEAFCKILVIQPDYDLVSALKA